MVAYRRLITVLGVVIFCWSANAFFRQRDTNDKGPLLKLPFDLYEYRHNKVVTVGLLTICPLGIIVNHVGWLIARKRQDAPRRRRIATPDKYEPSENGPESLVYAGIFAVAYHVIPMAVATHLLFWFLQDATRYSLWDFSASGLVSGNSHRYEEISYYTWIGILIIVAFIGLVSTFIRLATAVGKSVDS